MSGLAEFIGCAVLGLLFIVGPLYIAFFGGLEWLLKRDERDGSNKVGTFKAANRTSDEK